MAAQTVTGSFSLNVAAQQTVSAGVINSYTIPIGFVYPSTLGQLLNATGAANSVDTAYSASLSLAAAVTTINLHAFTDPGGNSVAMARCRAWAVYNTSSTAGFIINIYTLTGTNPVVWLPLVTTNTLWVPPGGIMLGTDPLSTTTNGWVVATAHNTFSLDPGANTVACDVLILGNSAA